MTNGQRKPNDGIRNAGSRAIWIGAVLFVGVALLYCVVIRYGFVNLDDPIYVLENRAVSSGLSWSGIRWAFASEHAANWHPLTWLSHMLDCQLFGLNPSGHHLTSVLLHGLNTALVFIVLLRLTGARWHSAFVAALFGLHPLHVESVAWISERKDVLSGFFFLCTLWAYVAYAKSQLQGQKPKLTNGLSDTGSEDHASRLTHHPSRHYALTLLMFALGVMSKPMIVTTPFLLLLLDFWPLGRLQLADAQEAGLRFQSSQFRAQSFRLALEKLPFFLLSILSCVMTVLAQKHAGAVKSLESYSLIWRLGNALLSYVRYLGKMVLPVNLAVPYPMPERLPIVEVVLAGVLVLALCVGAWRWRRRRPWLFTGWFWFVGMLVPVIGIVQTGGQSMADRYAYLPSIGLFIVFAWGAAEVFVKWKLPRWALGAIAGFALIACGVLTPRQLVYWRSTETLFTHAIAVTRRNYTAEYNLGCDLENQGRLDAALQHYQRAREASSKRADPLNNIGHTLTLQRKYAEAVPYFEAALKLRPDFSLARNNLGIALRELGRTDAAIEQWRLVLQSDPNDIGALNNVANALANRGQFDQAIEYYGHSIIVNPNDAVIRYNLGRVLAIRCNTNAAIQQLTEAIRLRPDYSEAKAKLNELKSP